MKDASHEILDLLQRYESPHVTAIEADGSWPIVWNKAKGVHVWDLEGRCYLDLTAAFGVAAAGHANPHVVRAARHQLARLVHAMGDVHPHPQKAHLLRALSRITFERWSDAHDTPKKPTHGKAILTNSGFESVEAALKTALLATQKPDVIAFEGAYHGLGYGSLTTTHRPFFRQPFLPQLGRWTHFVPFPDSSKPNGPTQSKASKHSNAAPTHALSRLENDIRNLAQNHPIGAILIEPIQGRGGIRVPPQGFLSRLRQLATELDALLILDEVYTGCGRTGRTFACEHEGVTPDLICLGKALTGGFPLSACVGEATLMDKAWPKSQGEALHTSTFLGHPVGCAMALAQIEEIETRRLPERSAKLGKYLRTVLDRVSTEKTRFELIPRGQGLMQGLEVNRTDGTPASAEVMQSVKTLLNDGYIMLPEGEHGNILSLTPPLTITKKQLRDAVTAISTHLESL